MRVRNLPGLVTASKADWLPAHQWVGFTPAGIRSDARQKCEAAIVRQMADGYILERVTTSFGIPNLGFENDPRIALEREKHANFADALYAIHLLRHAAVPLREIVGDEDFDWLQNAWAEPSKRNRWSVAFPIVKSFMIIGAPKAKHVLSSGAYNRIYRSQNALLRPFDDEAREQIADLELEEIEVPAVGIALTQDFEKAERSDLVSSDFDNLSVDLEVALEGESDERRTKLIKRATWLADKFIRDRMKLGNLACDACKFYPQSHPDITGISARSYFDVHHRNPLAEGKRLTGIEDFALLCPTCHRIEHLRLRSAAKHGGVS